MQVVPELPTPQALEASDAPDAVHLEWHAAAPEFRIFRKLVPELNWTQIGTPTKPSYTDNTIEYGKTYQYMVQSIQKTEETYAESELSDVKTIKPVDKFPPAVPAGVTAVPGTRTIELVGIAIRRRISPATGFTAMGRRSPKALPLRPSATEMCSPRSTYHYEVSAVDTAGTRARRSAAVEAIIP